jgi:hypothetical protein
MHVTDRHKLVKRTLLVPDYTEAGMPFEGPIAHKLHQILALTFVCFDAWLKPLFSQAKEQSLSPVQEYDPYADPYIAGLLRHLQTQRRD